MERDRTAGHRHGSPQNNMNALAPGRSAKPPAFGLTASNGNFLSGSIGQEADNKSEDIIKLTRFLSLQGLPTIFLDQLKNPKSLGKWVHKYQQEVLGWSGSDGKIDPGGKTIGAILNLEGREIVKGWAYSLLKKKNQIDRKTPKADQEATEKNTATQTKDLLSQDGWTIPSVLSTDQYHSQAHPSLLNGVNGIPRHIAFSGALAQYDRNGKQDIYNESTVKRQWKNLSITKREQKVYWRACKNTATFMAKQGGYSDTGAAGSAQTLVEEGKSRKPGKDFNKGISRLDNYLMAGIPVVAGVDKGKKGLNASATDHYIVIVGRGLDDSGKYYTYFDPGRLHAAGYDLTKNRLYVGKDAGGSEKSQTVAGNNGSHNFTLSEVRTMKENH